MKKKRNKKENIVHYAIAIVAGGTLVSVLIMWFIGARMPADYAVWERVSVEQSAEEVWSVIAAIENTDEWRSTVDSVETLKYTDNRMPIYAERKGMKKRYFEVVQFRPGQQMQVKEVKSDLDTRVQSYNIELFEENDEQIVSITKQGRQSSPIARFFGTYVHDRSADIRVYLQDLTGELNRRYEQ